MTKTKASNSRRSTETDQLDLEAVCNDFIQRNGMRREVSLCFLPGLFNDELGLETVFTEDRMNNNV